MSVERDMPASHPQGRGSGGFIALIILAIGIAVVSFGAGWLLGSKHLLYMQKSPSGDAVALVMESGCEEGACESLWVGPDEQHVKKLEVLAANSETSDDIAWTSDGGRVAFVVNGYQLRVFDAHTGKNLGAVNLIEPDGFPSSRIARGVTFSSNGAAVTFDDCPRDRSGCKPGMIAVKTQ